MAAPEMTRGINREYAVFLIGLFLVLLLLSRYVVNGEPIDIRSDETKTALEISDGIEIRQPLHITDEMNWRQGYYALRFASCDQTADGWVICMLEQGEMTESAMIKLSEIKAGDWVRLDALHFSRLESGDAVLSLKTADVSEGELKVAAGQDYYGFGHLSLNGVAQELTLAQAYHYHIIGAEYRIRLLCYGIIVLCIFLLALLVYRERTESKAECLSAFFLLTILFMAVIYVLDSSIYLEPTYAEAVTNFLHFAREESLASNLLITDAGYLPLLPRLITLFGVKVLRIPSIYVLYFMQAMACLFCSAIWSFFVLYPFRKLMRLPDRILWCIMVMLTCFCEETLFFTNHGYWGMYLLLLLFAADLTCLSKWFFGVLMAVCAVICLSKGTYVIMIPLSCLYFLFFHRYIDRRHKVFVYVTGIAALVQLIYSFGGQGDGGGWINAASMQEVGFWFRLIGRVFVEFTAYGLTPFGRLIQSTSGFVMGLTVLIMILLLTDFVRKVFLLWIHGKEIDGRRMIFYTMVMFQMINSAFYLVTVKPVPDSWKEIGQITCAQMGDKYEIFSNVGFYMLLLATGYMFNMGGQYSEVGKGRQLDKVRRFCGRYGIIALMMLFCLTNPIMQLYGWRGAKTSDERVYHSDINASWWDCKELISENSFFIPVRYDNWAYSRNITLYQVGAEEYFEETGGMNLEGTLEGYQEIFELQEDKQTESIIEVMIEQPVRLLRRKCRVQLLDAKCTVVAEAGQIGDGRNKKCVFRFAEPVSGAKAIRFVDETGDTVYFKDYIAWACAW